MKISTEDIQKLRKETGAGVMDCRRALEEAGGNFEKAAALIHERGLFKVEKRAEKEAGAGLIHSYVHNERIGVLVDLRAETDFVVRSEPFKKLIHELAMQIAATAPGNIEELLNQPYIKNEEKKVLDLINEVISIVGENIKVNSFYRMEI